MTETDLFASKRPQIAEADAIQAANSGRVVQSFNSHPIASADGSIPAIAIKWQLGNGQTETLLIDPNVALVLRLMFSHLEANKWTELATLPQGATRQ
jgi:hypothetical protein